MSGEQETVLDAAKLERAPQTRQRSKIAFPYMDLKAAIDMAVAIYSHVGVSECDDDQLGPWTDQSSKSSTFRVQIYAARTFGILEGEGGGKHKLSVLGRAIVDPNQTRDAKARAFLNVPLYKAIFEKYRGGVLPPPAALQRDIVDLGVAEKQKDRARLVFERSAEQAGFFENGKDRLVMPGVHTGSESAKPEGSGSGGGGDGEGGGRTNKPAVDPIITGLLARLPEAGSVWPEPERDLWLQLLKGSFQLIYKDKQKVDLSEQ